MSVRCRSDLAEGNLEAGSADSQCDHGHRHRPLGVCWKPAREDRCTPRNAIDDQKAANVRSISRLRR